jgi:hypothetical protein
MLIARAILVVVVLVAAIPSVVTIFGMIGLAIADKYHKSHSHGPTSPPGC